MVQPLSSEGPPPPANMPWFTTLGPQEGEEPDWRQTEAREPVPKRAIRGSSRAIVGSSVDVDGMGWKVGGTMKNRGGKKKTRDQTAKGKMEEGKERRNKQI